MQNNDILGLHFPFIVLRNTPQVKLILYVYFSLLPQGHPEKRSLWLHNKGLIALFPVTNDVFMYMLCFDLSEKSARWERSEGKHLRHYHHDTKKWMYLYAVHALIYILCFRPQHLHFHHLILMVWSPAHLPGPLNAPTMFDVRKATIMTWKQNTHRIPRKWKPRGVRLLRRAQEKVSRK